MRNLISACITDLGVGHTVAAPSDINHLLSRVDHDSDGRRADLVPLAELRDLVLFGREAPEDVLIEAAHPCAVRLEQVLGDIVKSFGLQFAIRICYRLITRLAVPDVLLLLRDLDLAERFHDRDVLQEVLESLQLE